MNVSGFILLLIAHFLTGRGLLQLFKIQLSLLATFCLSMITGVMLLSFIPFAIELMHIPITSSSVLTGICVMVAGLLIPILLNIKSYRLPAFTLNSLPRIYELPFIITFICLVLPSVWHAYYFPPFARDMLSGPEVIAEYAVREHTFHNSVYSIDLQTTNNYLKPPFVTSLQIIYKLFVDPFGGIWLSLISVPFLVWLYALVRRRIHPLLAGVVLLFFISIQELYAYSYIMLFDYSNMVLFFMGFYFLIRYFYDKRLNEFLCAVFLFGMSVYIRTETLLLIYMAVPLLLFYFRRDKLPVKDMIIRTAIFMIVPAFFYFIWINVYVKHNIPVSFDVAHEVNTHLGNLGPFFDRLSDITTVLIFGELGTNLYGYFMYFFVLVAIADVIFFRKYNREAVVALYGVLLVYFGLALLGYLLPLVDLNNTTKRGMFKIFPFMVLYLCNSGLMTKISSILNNWELSIPQAVKPQAAPPKLRRR